MRLRNTLTGATLAALCLAGSSVSASLPARALVYAREYRLTVSREVAPAGRLVIELRNIGEDDHDLAVRRARGGAPLASTPIVRPGRGATLDLVLRPGRYVLYCTVADHADRGMQRTLTVKRQR